MPDGKEQAMSMTREQMDNLVDEHFGFEAADDVDGVMGTLDEDAEHEVIPSPFGAINDPATQRSYYENALRCSQGRERRAAASLLR
jgi:hypothetical protein